MALVLLSACSSGDKEREAEPVQAAVDSVRAPDSLTLARFRTLMDHARNETWRSEPVGDVVQKVGLFFAGSPYLIGPLTTSGPEQLVCRLDGFDCVTFDESALALARSIQAGEYEYDAFVRRIRQQRYRDPDSLSYCNRLHYFTDWIRTNERRGLVHDVTKAIGGRPFEKELDFITSNRSSYPQLANEETFECMQEVEENLAGRSLHYLPEDRLRYAYDELRAGDLLAMVTDREGLDVVHTGIAYREPGSDEIGLLHASTSGGVKVSPDLQEYVRNVPHQIGIVVARPTGE